jgi:hypothetical protein
VLVSLATFSCDVDLGVRYVQPSRTFGEIVYGELCERVAYTGELAEVQAGQRSGLDASGIAYRGMCNFGEAPPAGAPPVMQAMAAQRKTIVSAIDTSFQSSLLDPLDTTLRGMLPAMDGQSGQQAILGGGNLLLSLSSSPDSAAAISRLGWRDGFRPPATEANAALKLLSVPDLYGAANAALPVLFSSSDGVDDAPGAAERRALFLALGREVAATTAVAKPGAADRTLNLTLRFLFNENAELRTLPAGQSYFAVLRDYRGLPQVNAPGGVLPSQFVDADKDGLADVDASGHFVAKSGGVLPDVTPFPLLDRAQKDSAAARDADGRALASAGGQPLYRYINLDDTVLAGLLRDAPTLLDPKRDIPLRLASGAKLLLGPRQPAHKDYSGQPGLDYSGFDTTQAPLLDILYGYLQLLGYSDIGDASGADLARLLRGVYVLIRDQESVLARNLQAVAKAFDEAKKPAYDDAQLAESSTLYDDIMPVLVRLLRVNGLLTDVLVAMTDPATADLGPLISTLMTDRDYFFMSQTQLDATQPGATLGSLGNAVNRSAPDSDVDIDKKNINQNPQNNRSIMQRVAHLVHDASSKQFCNKEGASTGLLPGTYKACELLKIDDLAQFYILSIADESIKNNIPEADFLNAITNSTLQGLMRAGGALFINNMIGIPGFKFTVVSIIPPRNAVYPSPEALARLLFQDNANRSSFLAGSMDLGPCNPLRPGTLCCNQNHSWQLHHDGTLFALEAVKTPSGRNFYQALRPIVNAFAKHDECIQQSAQGNCTATRNASKILVDLISVLHRHYPSQQSKFYGLDYEPQNQKSSVKSYEPIIAKLLGQGDLWPSSLALASALLGTQVDDGSKVPISTLVSKFAMWLLDPAAPRLGGALAFRDGRTAAVRNDGKPTFQATNDAVIKDNPLVQGAAVQGKVTPYDILADAYRKKRASFATAPAVAAGWKEAVSNLADIYLLAQQVGAGYKFQNPRVRSVELALLDHLRERVQSHGAAGDLKTWVQGGLYGDISSALTGPVGAGLLDVLDRFGAAPDARQKVPLVLASLALDPGPAAADAARFRAMLTITADLLQMMADDGDLVPIMQKLGAAFVPDTGPVDGSLAVLRRGLPADASSTLLTLGRNLFTINVGGDTSGLYPAYRLNGASNEVNRPRAGESGVLGTALTEADYPLIVKTIGQFLADHQRGGARIVDIVQSRALPK